MVSNNQTGHVDGVRKCIQQSMIKMMAKVHRGQQIYGAVFLGYF